MKQFENAIANLVTQFLKQIFMDKYYQYKAKVEYYTRTTN